MEMTPLQQKISQYADEIESEMRRIGMWQTQPLRPEQMTFKQAFAMDTMAFSQWLQFIFLPRVREAVASNSFPKGSSVGAQAVREFDGDPKANQLVMLLSEFDALFD
jgi:uncharacterized protein YqcC (DUF446 family)